MLQLQVVMLGIGRGQILRGDRQHGEAGWCKGIWPSGDGIEEVRQKWGIQHHIAGDIADDGFIEDAIGAAQHGLARAEYIPGQANPGREVVTVRIVDIAHVRLQHHSRSAQGREIALDRWIAGIQESCKILRAKRAEATVCFMQNRVQLIAQAVVQGQIAREFEAVFCEEVIAGGAEVPVRVSNELKGATGKTFCKINQRVRDVRTSWASGVESTAESYLAAECQVIQAVELRVADVAADFESVTGGGVREVIYKLICIDRGTVGLVDAAAEVGDCGAAGNKSTGKSKLRDIA